MTITSFTNQKVKLIRKLEYKKFRKETGLFFIEGLKTVGEALQTGAEVESLIYAYDLLVSEFGRRLLAQPAFHDIERIEVSAEIFEKIAHKQGSQGIGAVVRQGWKNLNDTEIGIQDLWVALDSVADPGNLGTIIRTAESVGCKGVILLGHSTDPYDPTAVKASMGALFSQQLVRTDWDAFHVWQVKNNLALVGTSDSAKVDYQAVNYNRPLILLMGSERHGLNPEMQPACDNMVRIPLAGRSDSLNVAVATAVILFEIFNQSRNREEKQP